MRILFERPISNKIYNKKLAIYPSLIEIGESVQLHGYKSVTKISCAQDDTTFLTFILTAVLQRRIMGRSIYTTNRPSRRKQNFPAHFYSKIRFSHTRHRTGEKYAVCDSLLSDNGYRHGHFFGGNLHDDWLGEVKTNAWLTRQYIRSHGNSGCFWTCHVPGCRLYRNQLGCSFSNMQYVTLYFMTVRSNYSMTSFKNKTSTEQSLISQISSKLVNWQIENYLFEMYDTSNQIYVNTFCQFY